MEYLEDYLSIEIINALEVELRKVYDNEEFVICTLSELQNDDEAKKLIDFLKTNTITQNTRYKVTIFQLQMEKNRTNN